MALARVLNFIRRYRAVFITAGSVLFAALAVFFAIFGMIIDKTPCPDSIIFGDPFTYEAEAYFSDVRYEFSASDEFDEPSASAPTRVGSYFVRAVSKSILGFDRHGKTHAFSIVPRTVTVGVNEDTVVYGDRPTVWANVLAGHKISCTYFYYTDLSKENVQVRAANEYIRVKDANGNDLTSQYSFITPWENISFKKRPLTITVESKSAYYNGMPLQYGGYAVTGGSLADFGAGHADRIIATFNASLVNAGTISYLPTTLRVITSEGYDVTDRYDINVVEGKLTVKPRPVVIEYNTDKNVIEFEYDGQTHSFTDIKISDNTPLVSGHKWSIDSFTTLKDAGQRANFISLNFTDAHGNPMNSNYYATFIPEGLIIRVNKRSITVSTADGEDNWIYNGTPYSKEEYAIVQGSLVSGHTHEGSAFAKVTYASTVDNTMTLTLRDELSADVTKNYDVHFELGTITVKKRPITVKTKTRTWIYDGTVKRADDVEVVLPTTLASGDIISVVSATTVSDYTPAAVVNNVVIDVLRSGVSVTTSYDITYEYGELKVDKRNISVTTKTKLDWIYDGANHALPEWDYDAGSLEIAPTHTYEEIGYPSISEASDIATENSFTIKVKDASGYDKSYNYQFSYTYGDIRINKRPIKVTTVTNSWEYDGEAHSDTRYTISYGSGYYSIVRGQSTVCENPTSVTNVFDGERMNVYTMRILEGTVDKSANYIISYVYGTLKITPRPVSIITGTNEWEYDGAHHSEKTFTYAQGSKHFVAGYDINFIDAPTVRVVEDGIKNNDYYVTVTRAGRDYTENYTITYTYGKISIKAREITVLTDTNEWMFDGMPHMDDGFTIIRGSLVPGDVGAAHGVPSVTFVTEGVVRNEFYITITNAQGADMKNNYRITYEYGNIEITPRVVYVVTVTKSWEYDGLPHDDNSWTYGDTSKHFLSSHKVTASKGPSVTEVSDGKEQNVFKLSVTNSRGEDMLGNYKVHYTYGYISIDQRPITVITATKSWEYDGNPHDDNSWTYGDTSKHFLSSHKVTASKGPSVTEVSDGTDGKVKNVFELSVTNSRGEDMLGNYKVDYTYGYISIDSRPITVITATNSWIYDGTSRRDDSWEFAQGSKEFLDTHTVTNTSSPLVRDAMEGLVENRFKLVVTDGVRDVGVNYNITYIYGKVSITPRPITIETHSNEWTYDGEYHSEEGYQLIEPQPYGIVAGEVISVVKATEIRDVRENKPNNNEITFSILRDGVENVKNYDITLIKGTVKINPIEMTVSTPSRKWKYDGEFHYDYEYVIESGAFLEGEVPTVSWYTKVRDVRETGDEGKDNKIVIDVYRDGEQYSDNYRITLIMGKLTITQRILYIETPTDEKVYDAKPLFNTEWTYASNSPDEILPSEIDRVDTYTKVTNVYEGKKLNEIIVDIYRDGEKYSDNYKITYTKKGTLEITPRPVSIITGTNEWVYDGLSHKEESFEYSQGSEKFVDGQTVTYIGAPSVKYVSDGVVKNEFTVSLFGDDDELDKNYDITYESYGTIEIKHRKISITTATDEWYYDGLKHSNTTFSYNKSADYPDEIVAGEIYDAVGYPEVRFVSDGTVTNEFTIIIKAGSDDVTDNYIIEYKAYGTLKIKKSPITLRAEDGKWEFDGLEHKMPEYEITSDRKLGVGDSAVVNIVGSQTEIGISDNEIVGVTMYSYDGFDTTENYEITLEKGTLEVVPRKITITSDDNSKLYDGTPLTDDGYRVTAGTVPSGHSITAIDIIGTITDAGSVPNSIDGETIVIMMGSRDVTDCYEITLIDGTLTVRPRKITITADSATKRYDGTPLSDPDYSLSGDGIAPNQTLECRTSGERTEVGTEPNIIVMSELAVKDALGRDVTKNYEITVNDGTLTVLYIATIEVITDGAEKKYDGTPLTCPNYKYIVLDGSIREGDTVSITVTGTRTEVGISDNTFTIVITDKNGVDATRHYDIRETLGKLEVLPRDDKDKYYGGELDGSGEIGSGLIADGSDNHVVMHLHSEYTGRIYLRYKSFGAYSGRGFLEAQEYSELVYGRFSFNYLTGIAMRNKGAMAYKLIVQPYSSTFALPYYLSDYEQGYDVQDSDVIYDTLSTGNYSLSYYAYQGSGSEFVGYLGELTDAELAYRNFVKQNYLEIDDETREFMQTIIDNAGLDASDPRIIDKVRDYISAAAENNDKYDTVLDRAENVVVAFLGQVGEGVSQHFAASATMLYRALGIPARYTIGYLADVKAGEWIELKASSSYAWVEVYVDGLGWVAVDAASKQQNIGGESEITKEELLNKYPDLPLDFEVRPVSVDKVFDGGPLFAKNELYADGYNALSKLLAYGFTYEVTVAGNRTEIGTSRSIIGGLTIYDPDGNDVTSLFDVTYLDGVIRVTKPQIVIKLHEVSKIYDGDAIHYRPDDYSLVYIPEGLRLEFVLAGSMVDVGVLDIEELYALGYRVFDSEDNDVTEDYFLKITGVGITVDYREITLTAASESREYNGQALTNDGVSVSFGELCDSHSLTASTIGSITDVGSVDNHVDEASILICDALGRNVTDNYKITTVKGRLTVTEP